MEIEFDDNGALGRLALGLVGAGPKVGARAFLLTRRFGILLQSRVKANAAGRPGPRMVTGDYNRSITVTTRQLGASVESVVGTNKPQGPRLEFGFVGEDSAGRTYNQPAYAHFGPAGDQTEPEFVAAATSLATQTVAEAMSGITAPPATSTPASSSGPARDSRGRFVRRSD